MCFVFLCLFCRSSLLTDIFLVLIVSITCVQTKEIKNSSSITFQQISKTHQNSSIERLSSEPRSHNHAFENHIWPTIQSANISTNIASNGSASQQRTQKSVIQQQQQQQQQIEEIQTISKSSDLNYSIDDNDSISLHNNEMAQHELPKMINNSKIYTSKSSATSNEPTNTIARNAKHSNILRSALRVAARQGFEAMVELYDKKEPNLISKGQLFINILWWCLFFVWFFSLFNKSNVWNS